MAISKLLPFGSSCKNPGITGLRIGPRLHLRLCAELLDLAHLHERLAREIQTVETRFEALLALVQGARR
jgi:hypothetical protein